MANECWFNRFLCHRVQLFMAFAESEFLAFSHQLSGGREMEFKRLERL